VSHWAKPPGTLYFSTPCSNFDATGACLALQILLDRTEKGIAAMATLLVTYDTKSPWLDYGGLIRAIKKHSWVRLTDNVFVIHTTVPAEDIFAILRHFLDDSANLYVLTIRKPFSGFGPGNVNDWLSKNLAKEMSLEPDNPT
jgi:hypothetical protein